MIYPFFLVVLLLFHAQPHTNRGRPIDAGMCIKGHLSCLRFAQSLTLFCALCYRVLDEVLHIPYLLRALDALPRLKLKAMLCLVLQLHYLISQQANKANTITSQKSNH